MASRRLVVLLSVLLAALSLLLTKTYWDPLIGGRAWLPPPATVPPLPGQNTVEKLAVYQDAKGRWMVTIDYFFTGEPASTLLLIRLPREAAAVGDSTSAPSNHLTFGGRLTPKRGQQRVTHELNKPNSEGSTHFVVAELIGSDNQVSSRQQIAQTIDWPDPHTWWLIRSLREQSAPQLLARAVGMIDTGQAGELRDAKSILERLIADDPKLDPAYIELARVAMKTNWGPEGLHQAESLLASALGIRPDNVNAKILQGYVFAHQRRYREAEALFAESAASDPRNLWLWANWGEVLVMQGKPKQAMEKYREAIRRPRTYDTYDHARQDAYIKLMALLKQSKDLDGMEALYQQRTSEFGKTGCAGAEYASFLLTQKGNAIAAADWARQALDGECRNGQARMVLGAAHYVAWANAPAASAPQASLNQARIYLPPGPQTLYWLATSEHTLVAAKKLIATGESVEQLDNQKMNSLGYALQAQDHEAARRLLRLGARPDTEVGEYAMPVALLPVVESDLAGVRMMQKAGVNYAKLRFRGVTALDHAKRAGNQPLIDALDPKGNAF